MSADQNATNVLVRVIGWTVVDDLSQAEHLVFSQIQRHDRTAVWIASDLQQSLVLLDRGICQRFNHSVCVGRPQVVHHRHQLRLPRRRICVVLVRRDHPHEYQTWHYNGKQIRQ